jgi:signal transduction histidine kinase/CHASE1-domain containing sensor protein
MPMAWNPMAWLMRQLLRRRRTAAITVFLVGALLTAGEFLGEWQRTRLSIQEGFRKDAAEEYATLRELVQGAVDSAASVADFLQTVGDVDRDSFRTFVVPHLSRAPGLISLVWAPRVPEKDRRRFEAASRKEWGPDFRIFERGAQDRAAGRRAEYFPVYYRETIIGPPNSRIVGQDWGADPVRLDALQRARDTGKPAMTAKVRLTRGVGGVHVYWPIYGKGALRHTLEERRASLQGFVGAIFEIGQLLESSLGQLNVRGLDIALFDEGSPGGGHTLYIYPSRLRTSPRAWLGERVVADRFRQGLDWTNTLEIAGRRWVVSLTPTAGYVSMHMDSEMWDDLLLGLVTTSLVGGCLLLLMRRTDEVERLVATRTKELEEARDRLLVEIGERRGAEALARNRAAQLEAVRTIGLEVIREVDLGKVLGQVARQAGGLLCTGTSTVWLWDEDEGVLVPHGYHGTGEWRRAVRLRLGEGVVGAVAALRQGLVVNDYRTSPYALPLFIEHTRTTAVVAEPLIYREGLLGVLGADNEDTGRPFTDEDLQMLTLFATQAAIAIHTAQLFDEVAAGREQARRLTQQIIAVQEEERRHLSRELQEEVGQTLAALVLDLRMIHERLPEDQAFLRQRIYDSAALARETVEQISLLARGLRPPVLDNLGLNRSLENLCLEVARRIGVPITYAGVEVSWLPEPVATCLYRVLQEALTNVAKHARATRVLVALRGDAPVATLSVEDDGQGFDASVLRSMRSRFHRLGLLAARERLELLGGRMEIVSRPGQGTRLIAEVQAVAAETSAPLRS